MCSFIQSVSQATVVQLHWAAGHGLKSGDVRAAERPMPSKGLRYNVKRNLMELVWIKYTRSSQYMDRWVVSARPLKKIIYPIWFGVIWKRTRIQKTLSYIKLFLKSLRIGASPTALEAPWWQDRAFVLVFLILLYLGQKEIVQKQRQRQIYVDWKQNLLNVPSLGNRNSVASKVLGPRPA